MNQARPRDTVVIAASAGGVEALDHLISGLPPGFPAAVLVVLHVPPAGGRALPRILARAGHLPAVSAAEGEQALPGHIYVAPPDHHLLFLDGKIRLSHGPRHNGHRPAADPLFMSAAMAKGPQAMAVVLSGTLDDGAAGCAAVEERGGLVLIQDPSDSAYGDMPRAALAATRHPLVLPLGDLAAALTREAGKGVPNAPLLPDPELDRQLSVFFGAGPVSSAGSMAWSGVSCPECGGPLRQREEGAPVRFECPSGHAWSPESLVAAQASGIERALWAAVVRLDERARLNRVLADTASRGGYPASAGGFLSSARAAESAARAIQRLLESTGTPPVPSAPEEPG